MQQLASRMLVLAALSAVLVAAPVGRGAAPPTRDARLGALLETLVRRGDSPGGILLVQTSSGTWRRASGAARLSPRTAMTPAARVRIGSVTKAFTAALVLQLVGEGALSLDDTVEKWRPGRVLAGAGADITVRNLLSHTSGITEDSGYGVAGEPGGYSYTNTNYILLGEIVEAATGSSFRALLGQRILVPLRLTRTELASAGAVPGALVHGYSPTRPRVDLTAVPFVTPAEGMVSTASDVARFTRALFAGRVLPRSLVTAMQTPGSVGAYDTAGYDAYGLGLMRFPSKCGAAWGHRGRISGYTSWMLSTADGRRSVVAFLNVGHVGSGHSALLRELSRLVTTALCT